MSNWQPIETAPHGECVLLYWRDWADREYMEVTQASWGERFPNGYSNLSRHGSATHWMPLPAAPLPEEATKESAALDLSQAISQPFSLR